MTFRTRLAAAAAAVALTLATGAAGQEAGGLGVTSEGLGPSALPSPLPAMGGPLYQAQVNVQAANPARGRQAEHQQAIARIRGDAGFLEGFHRGQPLAPSRQPPPEFFDPGFVLIEPFVINNFGSAVSIDLEEGALTTPEDGGDGTFTPVPLPSAAPTINNVGSIVNVASGTGNVAQQTIVIGR